MNKAIGALAQAQIPIIPEHIVRGDWTFESGYELSSRLLRQNPRPTALFVVTELMAAASLQAATALKLRVPRDVAVVTIGDSIWVRYVQPPLTAAHVPMMEVATQATSEEYPRNRLTLDQARKGVGPLCPTSRT